MRLTTPTLKQSFRRWCVLLALASAFGGCDHTTTRATSPHRPVLVALDSVILQEGESFSIGRPRFLLHAPSGDWYVNDAFRRQIARFSRDGAPIEWIGRAGKGPGELTLPGVLFLTSSGELVVTDNALMRATCYQPRSDAAHSTNGLRGTVGSAFYDGADAWLGSLNYEHGTAVIRWKPCTDSLTYLAPMPQPYSDGTPLAGIFDGSFAVRKGDTLTTIVAGDPWIVRRTLAGAPIDSFMPPVVLRRGVPPDLGSRLQHAADFPEQFAAASHLFDLRPVAGNYLGVLYYDQDFRKTIENVRAYLTLVSPDRKRACTDIALPASGIIQPRVVFEGDSLFILDQHLDADSALVTVITSYRLNLDACDWMAVAR